MALGICIVVALVFLWFVACEFFNIAKDKGYKAKKYFWICFLTGPIGWLLVCAMPDRGQGQNIVSSDELPEL